jgi:hypothetical protein
MTKPDASEVKMSIPDSIGGLDIAEWCDYWHRSESLLAEDSLVFETDSEKLMLAELRCAAEAIRDLTAAIAAERERVKGCAGDIVHDMNCQGYVIITETGESVSSYKAAEVLKAAIITAAIEGK